MFKFGFDLPAAEEGGGDGNDTTEPSPATSAHVSSSSPSAAASTNDTTTSSNKNTPPLKVINMADAIRAVFESDTLFEYVSLENNQGTGEESDTSSIKPLRRVVFRPHEKMPPSLSSGGDTTTNEEIKGFNKESIADTDLIPGVYEGGLKVWECSLDLCRHLNNEILRLDTDQNDASSNDVRYALEKTGKTLELGCGHGLPACLLFRELLQRWDRKESNNGEEHSDVTEDGAQSPSSLQSEYSVIFSDYNEFVLRDATIPNIVLNMDSERPCPNDASEWEKIEGCVGCVSGDWMDLSNKLQSGTFEMAAEQRDHDDATSTSMTVHLPADGRFDLILAAETTYTESSAVDTAKLLCKHLRPGTGVGLIATKRYYFGVGGGADAFRQAAADLVEQCNVSGGGALDCSLSIETVTTYDTGVGRDLLRARLVPLRKA